MEFREACREDFESAVALYEDYGNPIPVAHGRDGLAQWNAIIAHPGTTVHVAVLDGRLIAAATLHILPNMTYGGRPYAFIENVITARDHRGKGVGRRVMERAVETAWAADVYKIMLLTGQDRADGAVRRFYESLGFSAEEKHGMTLRRLPPRKD